MTKPETAQRTACREARSQPEEPHNITLTAASISRQPGTSIGTGKQHLASTSQCRVHIPLYLMSHTACDSTSEHNNEDIMSSDTIAERHKNDNVVEYVSPTTTPQMLCAASCSTSRSPTRTARARPDHRGQLRGHHVDETSSRSATRSSPWSTRTTSRLPCRRRH